MSNRKEYLISHDIISHVQSVQAALKVINDFIEALHSKKHCAAFFIDFSEAFNTVDHVLLKQKLWVDQKWSFQQN